MFFETVGEANGPQRVRGCGKLSLGWPIWEPWKDQQLIRGEIYCRFVLQCAVEHSAVSASVERDIAIIATRAPRLPEALPNPITEDRRIDLYAFPIDPTRQHLNGHLIAISCGLSSLPATISHERYRPNKRALF